MYKDGLHSQGSGNSTGVLAACTPETCQHVLRGIVTLSLSGCLTVEVVSMREKNILNKKKIQYLVVVFRRA